MIVVRGLILAKPGLHKQFSIHGFNVYTMMCQLIPYASNYTEDVEPIVHINTKNGFELYGKLMIDLECTPDDDPDFVNFKHVFTIVSNRFYFADKFRIKEGFIISMRDFKMNLNIDHIGKSNIGPVDVYTEKILIDIL